MVPARRRPVRSTARPGPVRRRPAASVPSRPVAAHVPLPAERPHAHIVCRVCGRIQGIELSELDCHLLTEIAERRPDGWSLERVAFSVAGACQRCRVGPSVR